MHKTKTEYMFVHKPKDRRAPDPRGTAEPSDPRPQRDVKAYYERSELTIRGAPLRQTDRFTYVGAVITNDGSLNHHVQYATFKAHKAEQARRARLLSIDDRTPLNAHGLLYSGVVFPHLMLAAEVMPYKKRHLRKLDSKALDAARWTLQVSPRSNRLAALNDSGFSAPSEAVTKLRLKF